MLSTPSKVFMLSSILKTQIVKGSKTYMITTESTILSIQLSLHLKINLILYS